MGCSEGKVRGLGARTRSGDRVPQKTGTAKP